MFSTEFEFTLPRGYADGEGNLHRQGTMRLAKAMDEIVPLRDPRVKTNPAYATVLILARVVTQLGAVESVNPRVIENLYAIDLNYLYDLYREVNELAPLSATEGEVTESAEQASPVLLGSVAVGVEQ
ncbi:MAG: hypothetical protein AAFR58_13010 [Cyanobacteria bacterium J06627_28]